MKRKDLVGETYADGEEGPRGGNISCALPCEQLEVVTGKWMDCIHRNLLGRAVELDELQLAITPYEDLRLK